MLSYTLKNDKYEIKVPSLTYGTANFDRFANEDIYFSILDKYIELGGNCIDTARVYCEWVEDGADVSEKVIGNWLEARNNRDKVIISTKGGHHDRETGESRLDRASLEYDLAKSLECLKTDYVDIYFLHRDDTHLPVEEIMPILDDFYRQGRVHFIGVSNWTTARIEKANRFAAENGLEPIRISQINYSLAHASSGILGDPTLVCMDTKEFSWYRRHHFPVMAFSPQAKGFFAKFAKGDAATNLPESQFASTANLARLARVKQLCKQTGTPPAVVPLGYLNSQPFFVSSVFAVTKLWQMEENMAAQDLVYDEKTLAFLDNRI
ncbi:aldo/keto reductase [Ruminococcus sp.]|uniref:aldo/keto reductase n=1 Tax=Ruminococcus sp. TaxID=41978 RepID=UPI001B05E17A|nr:aldo/keto reductase [Ruminococcus sp.]MBO5559825.1 aldo/keto reductase [Ruminococcus sp.]